MTRRGGRYRRARLRWQMQRARRLRHHGVCPCGDDRIDQPGPHLAGCLWADVDNDPDDESCWCGEQHPAYLTGGLAATCDGSGFLECRCGGDQCVCYHHGEVECPGCSECNGDGEGPDERDDDAYDDDGGFW